MPRQSLESQMIDGVFPTKATEEGIFKTTNKPEDISHIAKAILAGEKE